MKRFLNTGARMLAEEAVEPRPPTAGVTILVVDAGGTVRSVNADFEQTAGCSRSAVLGRRIVDLGYRPGASRFGPPGPSEEGGEAVPDAGARRDERLTGRSEEVPVFPVVDSTGNVSHYVVISAEATAFQRASETARRWLSLECAGGLAGDFARHVNTVLAPMIGSAGTVLSWTKPGDPARRPAEAIVKAGKRADLLMDRLLAFGRKLPLCPEVLDLNVLLAAMESRIRGILGDGIACRMDPSPTLGPVKADPDRIERVVMDLVVNACEAMPAGGRVGIETANVDLDRPLVRQGAWVAPGPYAMLSVSDTGTGMNEDTRARVFEPFFTTKPGALGLGLSAAYGFVKQTGGHMWANGRPGLGALFTIYLPRLREEGGTTP